MATWVWILLTQVSQLYGQGFEIGSYILTQYALDDAPTRYATWVQQALTELNNQTLYDTGDCTNNCWWGDYWFDHPFLCQFHPSANTSIQLQSNTISCNI